MTDTMDVVPIRTCVAEAHPSLALIKYWGKRRGGVNLPATTSVAVTLSDLTSTVRCSIFDTPLSKEVPRFILDGVAQEHGRLAALCRAVDALRTVKKQGLSVEQALNKACISVEAKNNFASSAGLASSASGGAALTHALLRVLRLRVSSRLCSTLARVYSGSACRAVFGGFVQWRCGARYAQPLVDEEYWSEFRVLVLTVNATPKDMSSRTAMEQTRSSSPYYNAWVRSNNALAREARRAVIHKDIEILGELAVRSYTAMHASAFAAYPPVLYWQAASVTVLHAVHAMRRNNIAVWETMDAGPQVKLITLAHHVPCIMKTLQERLKHTHGVHVTMRVCGVGSATRLLEESV